MTMSYYWAVPLLVGFICLYSRIFAYYHKQLPWLGMKMAFYVLLLLSSISLLVLTSQIISGYWLLGYVTMGGLSTVALLIYDYKLHRCYPNIPLWCQNFSELNYIAGLIIVIAWSCLFYEFDDPKLIMVLCPCFAICLIALLFLYDVNVQKKLAFYNLPRSITYTYIIISKLFYYFALLLGIIQISITMVLLFVTIMDILQ